MSEDERKFIEIETLLANHQAGNIFARLKEVNDRLTQKKKSTTIDASQLQSLISNALNTPVKLTSSKRDFSIEIGAITEKNSFLEQLQTTSKRNDRNSSLTANTECIVAKRSNSVQSPIESVMPAKFSTNLERRPIDS